MSLLYKKNLYLVVILVYICIGAISGAYVTLDNEPRVSGFMFSPWNITYTINYVDVINNSPVLVAGHAGATFVFIGNRWFKVNAEVNSACVSERKIVLAGQLNGNPLLAVIKDDGKGILYLFNITGSLVSVRCEKNLVIAGGTLPRPFILTYDIGSSLARVYILSEELPGVKISLDIKSNCTTGLVELINGSIILFRLDLNGLARPKLYSLSLGFKKARVEGVTCSNQGPLLYGSFARGNSTLGFLYFQAQNELITLRSPGLRGVRILTARELGDELIRIYLRPVGDFWDGMGELNYKEHRVWFSRLFWPYNHVVLFYNVDSGGNVTTATVLYTESGNLLVITKGFYLMPAILWHKGVPLFYIKKPIIGENVEVFTTTYHAKLKLLSIAEALNVHVESRETPISPYPSEIRPQRLSLEVNKGIVFALSTLFSIVIGVVIYEAFKPRV